MASETKIAPDSSSSSATFIDWSAWLSSNADLVEQISQLITSASTRPRICSGMIRVIEEAVVEPFLLLLLRVEATRDPITQADLENVAGPARVRFRAAFEQVARRGQVTPEEQLCLKQVWKLLKAPTQ